MAYIEEDITHYSGGLEGKLSGMAGFIIFLGVAILIACIIISGLPTESSSYRTPEWGENGVSLGWIGAGISSMIVLVVWAFLFYMGAEILRLLKKLNKIPYGGEISIADEFVIYRCSNCKVALNMSAEICPECGEGLENYENGENTDL